MPSNVAASVPESAQRKRFIASDDGMLLKQIQEMHAPDGRDLDVKPVFHFVEDILKSLMTRDVPSAIEETSEPVLELEAHSDIVNRLNSEIAYKCVEGVDGHATTVSLLSLLSSYPWDAKLVLTLAAFALNYGEFWLLLQMYPTNKLANRVAILRQLPDIFEFSNQLEPLSNALNSLIESMLDLTKSVLDFNDLPSDHVSSGVPTFSIALSSISIGVYWTIRSVIACATSVTYLAGMGHESIMSTRETWELVLLKQKIRTTDQLLKKQLSLCLQLTEEKQRSDYYGTLLRTFETSHIDNTEVLKLLISTKEDEQPLFDGSTEKRCGLDVLRRKTVLVLISDLEISLDERRILGQIYTESRSHVELQYDVVWMAMVDSSVVWTDEMQRRFEQLMRGMKWYTVHHPSLINPAVSRFVREKFHFKNQAILVALDPQGKVVNQNALHMLRIWGNLAFPFTRAKEAALWKEETWRLELIVDKIDQNILNWMSEKKYIFLYGGDDIEWIRSFTTGVRRAYTDSERQLEVVYVGKSTGKIDQIRRLIGTIKKEKLSSVWTDHVIWFFWSRLESMLLSRIQLGFSDEYDRILQEIKKLHSYDKSGSWALLSGGGDILTGYGPTVLATFLKYNEWHQAVTNRGFGMAFREKYEELFNAGDPPCCRIEFPRTTSQIPETLTCPDCGRGMHEYFAFFCCHSPEYKFESGLTQEDRKMLLESLLTD